MTNLPQALPFKMSWPENKHMANLRSVSFVEIMPLHERLTHKHSQKKPRLHFGKNDHNLYMSMCVTIPV